MSKGNYSGKLSEKDQILKNLKDKQKNMDNPELEQAIEEKIDVLKKDETVHKT